MANFGNPITDGTQQGNVGAYGYIVTFDLSGELLRKLSSLQVVDTTPSPDEYSAVIDAATELSSLLEYLEDENCPDVAWCQTGSIINVFFKSSKYSFTSAVRIAFWFTTEAIILSNTGQFIDPPNDAKELLKNTILKQVYTTQGLRVPVNIENVVSDERSRLGV